MQRLAAVCSTSQTRMFSCIYGVSGTEQRLYSKKEKIPKRSSHDYSAAEASDTGSRNESAYIPYVPYTPKFWDIRKRMGMFSLNNVLTMPVFDCAIIFGSCFVIAFFLWELWCRRHYQFIDIPAPKAKASGDEN